MIDDSTWRAYNGVDAMLERSFDTGEDRIKPCRALETNFERLKEFKQIK